MPSNEVSPGRGQPPASAPLWQLLQSTAAMVQGVRAGQSLTALLATVPSPLRAGTQALSFATLRLLGTAEALRRQLAPRRPAPAVEALLCTALALLLPDDAAPYPAFTLVNQAVEAAKRQDATRRQASFINACLRRFMREQEGLLGKLQADPVARWNHPAWWVRQLQQDHPDAWQSVLDASQHPAPMDLRVHAGRTTVAAYLEQLAEAGVDASALGGVAVRLARPRPVRDIPGHDEGLVSVQSVTAQNAAPLLLDGIEHNALRVLDACAAPGGKAAHLLELRPHASVTALDLRVERTARIHENLQRLGLQADVRAADAGDPESWWDGQPFDAILLDAPCSASGIARRHPDVRWLRRESDLAHLAREQDRLLTTLWPLLAPGGRLLYCTCSVFLQEGAQRIDAFMDRHTDAIRRPAPGYILPRWSGADPRVDDNAECEDDGFFYALLEKRAPG